MGVTTDSYIGFYVELDKNVDDDILYDLKKDNKYGLTPFWGSKLKHGDVVILYDGLDGQYKRLVYILDYIYEGQYMIGGKDLSAYFKESKTARGRLEEVYKALFGTRLEGDLRLVLDTHSH